MTKIRICHDLSQEKCNSLTIWLLLLPCFLFIQLNFLYELFDGHLDRCFGNDNGRAGLQFHQVQKEAVQEVGMIGKGLVLEVNAQPFLAKDPFELHLVNCFSLDKRDPPDIGHIDNPVRGNDYTNLPSPEAMNAVQPETEEINEKGHQ